MGGRFGKYGDAKRKKRIRTSKVTKSRMDKLKPVSGKKPKGRNQREKDGA